MATSVVPTYGLVHQGVLQANSGNALLITALDLVFGDVAITHRSWQAVVHQRLMLPAPPPSCGHVSSAAVL
jgi:hypothetical protein